MNRSSLRTLKCDRNTLPKPSDEDASRGGRSAMVGKSGKSENRKMVRFVDMIEWKRIEQQAKIFSSTFFGN